MLLVRLSCEAKGTCPWEPIATGEIPTHVPVLSLALHPSDDHLLYAGTYDEIGLYRTTDGGISWEKIGWGKPVYALLLTPQRLFAGASDGLRSTTDGGLSWEVQLTGLNVYALASDEEGHLYAGTGEQGVWYSEDGQTWHPLGGPEAAILALWVEGGVIYAGTSGQGLFLSRDGGRSWQAPQELAGNYISVLLGDGRGTVYARTRRALYRTDDNGHSWQQIAHKLKARIDSLAFAPEGTLYAGTGGKGIYRSKDGGQTWQGWGEGIRSWVAIFALALGQKTMYAGAWDGLYRSDDGGKTWQLLQGGLGHPQVNALASNGQALYAATLEGIYLSKDNGDSWQKTSMEMGRGVLSLAVSPDSTLYAASSGGLYRSRDGGQSWELFQATEGMNIPGVLVLKNGLIFIRAAYERLYASEDDGHTWQPRAQGFAPYTEVISLAAGNRFLYAGADDGFFRSPDNGRNWERTGPELNGQSIFCFHVEGETLYAGATRGLYRSLDEGESWQFLGPAGTTVTTLVRQGKTLYIGTKYRGVYYSEDEGQTWQAINEGLGQISVKALLLSKGKLYAATPQGLYRRCLP